jgi:uncharacterized membrane protein
MKNTNHMGTRRMVQLALLAAITLVMAYTPLGYFRTPVLSVSFLTVPVAIGAILLGPTAGALLGLIFGLTSFADAFTGGGMKAMLLALNPAACFATTVVARLLCGLLCGLIFAALSKATHGGKRAYILAALSCPLFNTVFFMGFIMLFYYNTDYVQGFCEKYGVANPFSLILAMVGIQGLIELVVCGILATVISMAVAKFLKKSAA